MSKKKKILIVIAVLLIAAVLFGVWYIAVKKPADEARAAAEAAKKTITVNITHTDGSVKKLELRTDKATLAEALMDENLVETVDVGYGMTITSLDGEEALMEKNASWCFDMNGEMGMNSIDATILTDGDVYDFYVLTW